MHSSSILAPFPLSWSNQLVNSCQLLFWLFLCVFLSLTSAQSSNRVSFDLQELTHDSPVIDPEKQVDLSLLRGEQVQFHLNGPEANQTLRLFLAKPFKVREHEAAGLGTLVEVNAASSVPYIKFMNANSFHRGFYHLYSFFYNSEGRLVNFDRIDFNVTVKDLLTEMKQTKSSEHCDSGHSSYGFCVCNQDYPIYYNYKNNGSCLAARNFNETCHINEQCQEFGGREAECFKPWGKCRCKKSAVPIKISKEARTCVPIAQLNHSSLLESCLFSMQCSLFGENRYCNGDYRCDCLPGYRLEHWGHSSHCSSAGQYSELPKLVLLFSISSLLILCL